MTRNSSKSKDYHPDWETPDNIINMVKAFFLGNIDLDVATSKSAQERIQAKNYYTKEDNGLLLPWNGNVWCNYPGGTSTILNEQNKSETVSNSFIWSNKGFNEFYNNPECRQILFCLFNIEHLNVSPRMLVESSAICYLRNRISFINEENNKRQPQHANGLVLLTKEQQNVELFKIIFRHLGKVVKVTEL